MDTLKSAGLGDTVITFPNAAKRTTKPPDPELESGYPLDLMQHIPDCNFKTYVQDVAKMCWLPVNSVLLVGLGVVSSVACRAYAVQYPNGELLPLGEYVAPCNPSATSKSRCLKAFQYPIRKALKGAIEEWKKQAAEDPKLETPFPQDFFVTNSSTAALDEKLNDTQGYFALASAEQGLVNTITGASFSKDVKTDNDLMLLGFNGDYHHSMRASRNGYHGLVVGAVTCFAQEGAINTILQRSEGSGFAERFLMLNEATLLGTRDHHKKFYPQEYVQNTYNRIVHGLANTALQQPLDFDELPSYRISNKAWWLIEEFRNEIEPHLGDGGKYSTLTLRSMAGKPDMHIMKIATLLALLDEHKVGIIPDQWVIAAINMMRDYLEYIYRLMVTMGSMGTTAYEDSLIEYIGKRGTCTRRQIRQAKYQAKPWSEITPKSAVGQQMYVTIDGLISKGIVAETESFDSRGNSLGRLLKLIA